MTLLKAAVQFAILELNRPKPFNVPELPAFPERDDRSAPAMPARNARLAPGTLGGPGSRGALETPVLPVSSKLEMPTTQETLEELKRRLAKEIYDLERDLIGGGRIKGKPCDCLSKKHNFGIEATAEELMSYDTSPVYGQVINWMNNHLPVFQPSEIAKHPPAYYQAMAPEVRAFRKTIMGTESLMAILNEEEKKVVEEKVKQLKEKGA
ncbi:MAG: hypothetical protein ABIH46_13035 [Chloroflexota bacterium]